MLGSSLLYYCEDVERLQKPINSNKRVVIPAGKGITNMVNSNSLPLGNRVPAVFLSLTGESKEAILNLEIEKLMTM